VGVNELLAEMRCEILRIADKYGAADVCVIGSFARGQARPDSDLDLLVCWRPEASLFDHAGLVVEMERLLKRKVDIASDGWIKPGIQENVYCDAVPL